MNQILFIVGATSFALAGLAKLHTALQDRRDRRLVTDTKPCDGGCGREIRCNEKHVTINRHIEYMDSPTSVTVLDAETVERYHLACAPQS